MGISKTGTLGLLLKAKQVGILSAIRPEIVRLRHEGFSVSQAVTDAVMAAAGE